MNTALKKINARVKQLQKKHPKTKRTTLQKQAGREYRTGKLKPARKRKVAPKKVARKRKAAPRKVARKRRKVAKVSAVAVVSRVVRSPRKRRRNRIVARRVTRRRSVGGGGFSMKKAMPILLIGGIALGAYLLLRKPASTTMPVYIPSGNAAKDAAANQVISWATAAGVAGTVLSQLIKGFNSASPAQAQSAAAAAANNNSTDLNAILAEMGG